MTDSGVITIAARQIFRLTTDADAPAFPFRSPAAARQAAQPRIGD